MQKNIEKMKNEKKKDIKELLEFGIINFDKPAGMTSFDVSDYVRRRLKLRKTSHFGTLDPMVTGVLPIALNRACKLTGFFLGEDKEYVGTMRIHEDVPIEKVEEAIKKGFLGKIMQMPPVKSRVKRQEREREIKNFKILRKEEKNISFLVECQGGTYVRKLVHDLGEEMGIGAHMTGLRRIRAGVFKEEEGIVKNEDFEIAVDEYFKGKEEKLKEMIIPAEIIQEVYPVVQIKKDDLRHILTGKPIHKKDSMKNEKFEKDKIICILAEKEFIGMYKVSNNGDIFAMPEFVLQSIKE
jgi:H/ACA ribonucleoprotein complex subunit 4